MLKDCGKSITLNLLFVKLYLTALKSTLFYKNNCWDEFYNTYINVFKCF